MKELHRALKVTILGFLLIATGLLALFLVSSALVKLGLNGDPVTYVIALGLTVLLPGSFLVASFFVPSTINRSSLHQNHVYCPSCGATVMVSDLGTKPKCKSWDHDLP